MASATLTQTTPFTINIPNVDLKRFKGLAKTMGWTFEEIREDYYESPEFYKDLNEAEQDIANGKGKTVSSVEELNALFV